MNKLIINQGRVFSTFTRLLGTILISLMGIKIMEIHPEVIRFILFLLISLGIPLLWFSFKILVVETDQKIIRWGYRCMGIKKEKKINYKAISDIVFSKEKEQYDEYASDNFQKINPNYEGYRIFITLDSGQKIFLLSSDSEQEAKKRVLILKKKLFNN